MPTLFDATTPAPPAAPKKKTAPVPPAMKKETTLMGPLTCFAVNPTGVRFETQEAEEQVILFLRQHIVVNIPWVILTLVLALAPTVLLPLFFRIVQVSVSVPAGYIVVGTLFWYLATFGYALAKFIGWFFNIYIVTNERVVDIDFVYLLYKRFSQAELHKIQDISYTSGGIFATIFNYGNVIIETAGESPNLEFDKVPYPEKIVETIRSLTEKTEEGHL